MVVAMLTALGVLIVAGICLAAWIVYFLRDVEHEEE
jgi:protein-S-isoprenylcysteine O-methyltransferase Ste14